GRGNTGNARKPPLLRIIDVPLLLVIGIHSLNIHKHQRCLRGNVTMCHTFKYELDVAGLELTSRAAAKDPAVMEKNVRTQSKRKALLIISNGPSFSHCGNHFF